MTYLIDNDAIGRAKFQNFSSTFVFLVVDEVSEEYGKSLQEHKLKLEPYKIQSHAIYYTAYQKHLNSYPHWSLFKNNGKGDIAILAAIEDLIAKRGLFDDPVHVITRDKNLKIYIGNQSYSNVFTYGDEFFTVQT